MEHERLVPQKRFAVDLLCLEDNGRLDEPEAGFGIGFLVGLSFEPDYTGCLVSDDADPAGTDCLPLGKIHQALFLPYVRHAAHAPGVLVVFPFFYEIVFAGERSAMPGFLAELCLFCNLVLDTQILLGLHRTTASRRACETQ